MKLLVLLNEGAPLIDGARPDEMRRRIADGFAEARADADVRVVPARKLVSHVQEAADGRFDAVIAAGGDRMLNDVVNAIGATGRKPFGVLPLGTHNHFASDLGMPPDLNEAIRAITVASPQDMFVGEVNGRIFLTLSAVGLEPEALGRAGGKFDRATAMSIVQRTRSKHDVRLSTRGRAVVVGTPCMIISNSESQLEALGINARDPERGLMNIYVACRPHSHGRIRRFLQRLPGQSLPPATHFQAMALPEMRLDSPRRRKLMLCIDGEMLRVRAPLHYRVRSAPMRVLVPSAAP